MTTILIVLAIVAALVVAALSGWRRGFIVVAGALLALLGALGLASISYPAVGDLLERLTHTQPSLANVPAYLLVLAIAQFGLLVGLQRIVRRLPHQALHSTLSRLSGGVLSVAQALIYVAIVFGLTTSSPVSAELKDSIAGVPQSQLLVKLGTAIISIAPVPSDDITQTLTLLTVDPESEKTVYLGFTTERVTTDEALESQMLNLVNNERTSRGLGALRLNQKARDVGRAHSRDMFARGYFSHISPDGKNPFDRLKGGGVSYHAAGENLALAPTLDLAHSGLMNSPGHKANILSPAYRTVGIGIVVSPRYGLMVSQEFTD
jgi:uncharacterized protein YkwD